MSESTATNAAPSPSGVRSYDDLAERLRALRSWAGLSYRELHRRVTASRRQRGVTEIPSADTVHRCLQPGRTRMDVELVVDIARALLGGSDGTAEWRHAHRAAAGLASEATVVSVTDSLPHEADDFVGRKQELDQLLTVVGAGAGDRARLVILDGMAGVGKTRFATHAAHRLAVDGKYDLTLWVNLRGYDADRPPADPAAVLDGFLRLLGVPGAQLAVLDLSRRTTKYRELLHDRRALIVLDNAASDDQVRPLLPSGPATTALITSRRRLCDLPEAHRVTLQVLDEAESIDLLRGIAGADRVAAEPGAADAIIATLGQLPLALNVTGTRIAATPDWTLADHLDRLREHRSYVRLDEGIDLALATSYKALRPESRRLLRLLGLHPGGDFASYAVAALAGLPLETAREQLADLTTANLLHHRGDDRFELHDLVRLFAVSRTSDEDPKSARNTALGRLYDHYLHTAMLAMDLWHPAEKHLRPQIPRPDLATPSLIDHSAAAAWLGAERTNLLANAFIAPDHDRADYTVALSMIFVRHLEAGGYLQDAESLHGLAAHHASGTDRGRTLNHLGLTYWRTGRHQEALSTFQEAIAIHQDLGDRESEARVQINRGIVHGLVGDHDEALDCLHWALSVHRESGNRTGEAISCGNLGVTYEAMGRCDEALECYERFLAIAQETGNRNSEITALANIGSVYAAQDRHQQALGPYRRALEISQEVSRRIYEPALHNDVGDLLRSVGQLDSATDHYRSALTTAAEIEDDDEQARAYEGLARCASALGQHDLADGYWKQAKGMSRESQPSMSTDSPTG